MGCGQADEVVFKFDLGRSLLQTKSREGDSLAMSELFCHRLYQQPPTTPQPISVSFKDAC
jgi:hypothetical protein